MKLAALGIAMCAAMVLAGSDATEAQTVGEDPAAAVGYVNQLRAQVGLVPFRHNALLDQSARNHAAYLSRNRVEGHFESPSQPGFTGAKPHERMSAVGYSTAPVGENVSNGSTDAKHSVDGLMSAIYHRIGFLSFDMDEAGMGSAPGPQDKRIYVYNMGSAQAAVAEFCKHPDPAGLVTVSGHFYEICPGRLKVKPEVFDALQAAGARRNPRMVVWPPRDGREVPVTFSGERPNPIPDRAMSGYPVSIHFNPAFVKSARLTAFRLFEAGGSAGSASGSARAEITATRILSAETDPNREFGALDFALFPLDRLEWDRTYLAQARVTVDGKDEEISWSFRTKAIGLPVYDLAGTGEEVPVRPGVEYAVRIAPSPQQPKLAGIEYESAQTVDVKLDVEDENTLRIKAAGPLCSRINMKSGNAHFTLRLADTDATAGKLAPAQAFAGCPEYSADFKIAAAGEELRVRPGTTYRIYIQPSAGQSRIGNMRFSYTSNVEPKFELEDANTVKATVQGASGGRVKVDLAGGRRFSLLVDSNAPAK